VIAIAGGAAARSGEAKTVDAAIAVEALMTCRRESLRMRIADPPLSAVIGYVAARA